MEGKKQAASHRERGDLKRGQHQDDDSGYLKYGPENRTDIFDYAGCLYPQGYHSPEKDLCV